MLTLAVTYAALLGGAERTLLDFARGLPGNVALACPEGALAERGRELGLRVFPLPPRRLELRERPTSRILAGRDLAGHAADIRRLASVLAPEVLLAWGMRSLAASPAALAGLRPAPVLVGRHVDFLPGPLVARLVRAAARRSHLVTVNSHAVARDLDPDARLGERLKVVSPGVDLEAYDPTLNPSPRPEALLLGAVEPWKRPDLALEAVALAALSVPDLRLVMAGEPMSEEGRRLEGRLRARAARPDLDGRVHFAGRVSDPRPLLSSAWCLLHCADREPFGKVILEALASGRPVVAPESGGPAEILDSSCGRVYRPGDAEGAAAALVEVTGLAHALGGDARRRAASFSADNSRRRFAELTAAALAGRGQARPTRREPTAEGDLALVTVTHNSADHVGRLLQSVHRHLPGARVIVVDSGSDDRSVAVANEAGATVVELGENAGFGRASNTGVALVDEPVCALVNPDVELVDGTLAGLATELADTTGPDRILAPRLLSPDGAPQDSAQLDPSSPLRWVRALVPPALLPGPPQRALDPWRSRRSRRVGWAVGACLVARSETLRRLGPFEERIFLFAEDLEFGLRADSAGVETWFRPDARVLHLDAHSTAKAFDGEPFDLLARQRRAVIGELRGATAARRDHRLWLLTYINRIALKSLARRPTARERRQLAAEWRARRAPADLGPLG